MLRRFCRILIFSWVCLLNLQKGKTACFAQSSKPGINFQAIAKDKNSIIAKNKTIYIKTELVAADSAVNSFLSEEHLTQTDAAGIFGITIGKGQRVGGIYHSLYEIPWGNLNFLLRIKIAIPPSPIPSSWNYQQEWLDMGTAPFEIVPYALYAQSTNSAVSIKSKSRTELVQQVDSLIIQLAGPLELDDGISISLEAFRLPMPVPGYFLFRDIQLNRVIVFFTAPFTGYVSWIIID